MPRPELSLVIPIYNEEEVLPKLAARLAELLKTLAIDTEVVFVDDGSKDKSLALLRGLAEKEPRYRVVSFARNFGHQRAITCGMDMTRGKAVVVMDADLQDPPEVILEMVAKWRDGYDVVYGRRRSREGESAFKLLTAKVFYRLFAAMIPIEVPLDTGDFRLMSRRVVQTLSGLRESHRFIRGLVAWVGFKQTAVEYDRAARAAGETKYPLKKMIAFAIDGIASFSVMPLRIATYFGVAVGALSVVVGMLAVASKLWSFTVPGWTTTVVLLSFFSSVQFLMMGVLGEYVGRIYEQIKERPLYIVAEKINFRRPARKRMRTRGFGDAFSEVTPIVPITAGIEARPSAPRAAIMSPSPPRLEKGDDKSTPVPPSFSSVPTRAVTPPSDLVRSAVPASVPPPSVPAPSVPVPPSVPPKSAPPSLPRSVPTPLAPISAKGVPPSVPKPPSLPPKSASAPPSAPPKSGPVPPSVPSKTASNPPSAPKPPSIPSKPPPSAPSSAKPSSGPATPKEPPPSVKPASAKEPTVPASEKEPEAPKSEGSE